MDRSALRSFVRGLHELRHKLFRLGLVPGFYGPPELFHHLLDRPLAPEVALAPNEVLPHAFLRRFRVRNGSSLLTSKKCFSSTNNACSIIADQAIPVKLRRLYWGKGSVTLVDNPGRVVIQHMAGCCSCSCKTDAQEALERSRAQLRERLDVEAVIERNVRILHEGAQRRRVKFPDLREVYPNIQLICTFSHLNPNLPIDEVYGNYVLRRIAERAGLQDDEILNVAYDNLHPGHDAPKGHRVQYVIVNPEILDPERIIHLQEVLHYDPNAVVKDGQNRIKSAPEQNIEAFRRRYDEIDAILRKHSGRGNVAQRILRIRREFFQLLGLNIVPERAFSEALTRPIADVLEMLYRKGYPFWEMPIPAHRDRYVEHTFLVEGVDARGSRRPARFEEGAFVFNYSPQSGEEKRIPAEKIFDALRNFEVVPTMPLVILATATAPQMPHLGGAVWKEYAPVHVDAQAEWLGIDERSDTLILSTEGYKPLVVYRHNQEFTGFPAIYMTYGREMIRRALEEGLQMRVEFKRVVF